jgi:hypothetical protein
MPLQSDLFRGDSRLEACLVNDSSHVTQGSVGDYVSKIQLALSVLDHASIDNVELRHCLYGSKTAGAVLAYKRKRNIINYNYQTQADNIVGRMTIAALDAEVYAKERAARFGNGVVCLLYCACPPDISAHRAHDTKRGLLFLVGSAVAGPSIGQAVTTDAQVMQAARQESINTLGQASTALDNLVKAINASKGAPLNAANLRVFIAVVRWLRVNPKNPSAAIPTIQAARSLMDRNVGVTTSTGAPVAFRRVAQGFHAATYGNPDNGCDCGTPFFTIDNARCRRDVLTHEFFHLLGVHHGGGVPSDANPLPRSAINTPAKALDSADNLAQLVAQLTTPGGRVDACG